MDMLRRREKGSWLKLATCLGAAGALLAGGVAYGAAATIVGQGDNTFNATNYAIDQGDTSTLQIAGGTHNATASQSGPDGKALFRSSTISGGSTAVDGTEYLTTGNYPFICTIHPTTMQATLSVSSNGTPKPRPQISLKLNSRKLEKVVAKGKLQVEINSSAKADGASVTAKLGKTTIARAPDLSLTAGLQREILKVGKKGRKKLDGREKATIVLNGSVPFGFPATAKGKLK
jgi:plastocyanin